MTFPPKKVRFEQFIEKLRNHNPVTNRNDAVTMMKELMKEVEDHHQLPTNDHIKRMTVYYLDAGVGWKNLESDPCYWVDHFMKHRTLVYNSGRIVIEYVKGGVVLDKPGG